MTILIVTHDLLHGFNVADKVIMLKEGKMVAMGTPAEIMQSKDEYVRRFLRGLFDTKVVRE